MADLLPTKEPDPIDVSLLLLDADAALTSISEAASTLDDFSRKLALLRARHIYDAIRKKRPRFSFADLEAHALDLKLEKIRMSLKRFGFLIDPAE